ncbi:hypothetical protein FRC08_002734 [Ceratobasidium sp. 394]|nr:hypothetical protein FRC08_002734 [Ceratobasidium sp. 394]KAG9089094.1 hypothetical protein FS749_001626 [Ceratobasidium sp. UAMH 11750]
MEPPSTFLPQLKRLDEYTAPELHAAVAKLVVLYLPAVRGTAAVDEDVEALQADSFERSFAIRWLTGFVSRGSEWAESGPDTDEPGEDATLSPALDLISLHIPALDTYYTRTSALNRATALLAACAGTSASGALSRTFTFLTSAPSPPITITLRDESLSVGDHTAVGLQTWGSACVLAERVAKDPPSFGFDTKIESRVLELGAGTGLLSLLAGKISILDQEQGGPGHTIIATDYHPAVMRNLQANVRSNFLDESSVAVHPLDWSLYTAGKPTTNLSRVPSTAATPIGTPRAEDKTTSFAPTSGPGFEQLTSTLPTPYTSLSPPSPQTPQSPKTPQTSRSPPPNLARAVFSRLMARGVKFDMPVEKSIKTGEPETEKVDAGEPEGMIFGEPFEREVDFEPNNRSSSLEADVHEQPWVNSLVQLPPDASARIYPNPTCSASTQTPPPLRKTIGLSTHVDAKQGCLDAPNRLAGETVVDMAVGTDAVSIPHVSLIPDAQKEALLGKACDICAERIEQKLVGKDGLGGEVGVGLENFGVGPNPMSESDIGVACKPATEGPTGLPLCPPEHMSAPFNKPFDIIFGADIIYELCHATLVHDVVQRLLRKPSYAPHLPPAHFHLIMPLRPTHADEATSVDRTFPRAEDVRAQRDGDAEVLAIVTTETYARSAGVGRADEVQYVYYKMAWV